MDSKVRQQPASYQSTNDADCDVGNQTKTCSPDDLPSEPSCDETHKQNDQKSFG
jgi:hypothetical protein